MNHTISDSERHPSLSTGVEPVEVDSSRWYMQTYRPYHGEATNSHTINQPINQSINQSINQLISQSVNQSISQSIKLSKHPANR